MSLNISYHIQRLLGSTCCVAHSRPFERHQLRLWSVCKPGYVLWQQPACNAQGVMGWMYAEQGDCKEHAVAKPPALCRGHSLVHLCSDCFSCRWRLPTNPVLRHMPTEDTLCWCFLEQAVQVVYLAADSTLCSGHLQQCCCGPQDGLGRVQRMRPLVCTPIPAGMSWHDVQYAAAACLALYRSVCCCLSSIVFDMLIGLALGGDGSWWMAYAS